MNLTLHLTDKCNLACRYCYEDKNRGGAPCIGAMPKETALRAVDMACANSKRAGFAFFGGEPLLEKALIYEILAYNKKLESDRGIKFSYKITTNGTLLDEEFLRISAAVNMVVGFSHDGACHDENRVYRDGRGSAGDLEAVIPTLLRYHPYAVAMCTVNPSTAHRLAESVRFLIERNFKYILVALNLDRDAGWTPRQMKTLGEQYRECAELYLKWTREEKKFYLSLFDGKIMSYLKGVKECGDRCQLGRKQLSVMPDGRLYPCVQFAGDEKYLMGDVFAGIDKAKQAEFAVDEADYPDCAGCALRERCKHTCGCMNKQSTGFANKVSPLVCMNEQMLIRTSDMIAEKLFKEKNPMFLHKQYNEYYRMISLAEDI